MTTLQADICSGEEFVFHNRPLTITDTYIDTLISSDGCDSIVELKLSVLEKSETFIIENICRGDIFPFNQDFLFDSGTYYDTIPNVANCDSIIELEPVSYTHLTLPTICSV